MYADSVVDLFRSEIHFENAFATFGKNAEKIVEKKTAVPRNAQSGTLY